MTALDNASLRYLSSLDRGEGTGARNFTLASADRYIALVDKLRKAGYVEGGNGGKPKLTDAGRRVLAANKRKFRR